MVILHVLLDAPLLLTGGDVAEVRTDAAKRALTMRSLPLHSPDLSTAAVLMLS